MTTNHRRIMALFAAASVFLAACGDDDGGDDGSDRSALYELGLTDAFIDCVVDNTSISLEDLAGLRGEEGADISDEDSEAVLDCTADALEAERDADDSADDGDDADDTDADADTDAGDTDTDTGGDDSDDSTDDTDGDDSDDDAGDEDAAASGDWDCSDVEGPCTYGDDARLDGLWDDCEGGDGSACDELFFESPSGSEYEDFGFNCGGRGPEEECSDA